MDFVVGLLSVGVSDIFMQLTKIPPFGGRRLPSNRGQPERLFKLLLMSYLLMAHWPKGIKRQKSGFKEVENM